MLSSPPAPQEVPQPAARRRSTFYVPLQEPSPGCNGKRPSPKRTSPAGLPQRRPSPCQLSERHHSPTARIRSPLLRVSAKLLSSSAQALEAVRSPANSPSRRSPLALVRRTSSRKLARSSSSLVSRPSNCHLRSSTPEPPTIVIEQLQDETILLNASDKALERRHHLKVDEDEAVHSGRRSPDPPPQVYHCDIQCVSNVLLLFSVMPQIV